MSTWITGDKHGEVDFRDLSSTKFPQGKQLTKSDYVITLGDFGVFWGPGTERTRDYLLKFYNSKKFTTLVVHGNHDNIPEMDACPEVPMFGSTVKQLSDSVFYLLNGHVYTIEDKKYFVMGGGLSIDKLQRREGYSWWKEEIPEYMTIKSGFDLLATMDNKIDYVLTHAIFEDAYNYVFRGVHQYKENDPMHKSLQILYETIEYKIWFCGHYHEDMYLDKYDVHMLYHEVVKIV